MKRSLEVCLITVALGLAVPHLVAQQSAIAPARISSLLQAGITTPILKKGISVNMPVAHNASLVPDADHEDALVVVVTRDGKLFFGIDPITPAALAQTLKADLSKPSGKKLYLKADARAHYSSVTRALEAANRAGVTAPVLLTTRQVSPRPDRPVALRGLEVRLGPASSAGAHARVQITGAGAQSPKLKVNDKEVPWDALQSKLGQLVQNGSEKSALLQADGRLPFADIVRVIDTCRGLGIQADLASPSTLAPSAP